MLCYWAVDQSFKRQSGEIDKRGRSRDHGQGDIEREMQGDEARILLGFSPGSRPSPSQVPYENHIHISYLSISSKSVLSDLQSMSNMNRF